MKIAYILLYCLSGVLFFSALLGNSVTKPAFDSISETTLEFSGFKKSYIQSVDDKIDELVYKSRQLELQIEKIKNFFSSEKVDESKYQRQENDMLETAFYNPLIMTFNYIYRTGLIFIAMIVLCFAVIFHIGYRSFELRKRVRRLEEIVYSRG